MNNEITPGLRVQHLREMKYMSQKDLARQAGITPSQLSRIETGETQTISSDILKRLVLVLDVSADYLLGISNIQSRQNVEITALGLSEKVVSQLVHKKIDADILNRLMENERFPSLISMIRVYFIDRAKWGIQARNEILDFGVEKLSKIKASGEDKQDIREMTNVLRIQKSAPNEAEMDKLKGMFISILKDIKADIDEGVSTTPPADMEMLREMLNNASVDERPKPSIDAFANILAEGIAAKIPEDNETRELVVKVLTGLMEKLEARQSDERERTPLPSWTEEEDRQPPMEFVPAKV